MENINNGIKSFEVLIDEHIEEIKLNGYTFENEIVDEESNVRRLLENKLIELYILAMDDYDSVRSSIRKNFFVNKYTKFLVEKWYKYSSYNFEENMKKKLNLSKRKKKTFPKCVSILFNSLYNECPRDKNTNEILSRLDGFYTEKMTKNKFKEIILKSNKENYDLCSYIKYLYERLIEELNYSNADEFEKAKVILIFEKIFKINLIYKISTYIIKSKKTMYSEDEIFRSLKYLNNNVEMFWMLDFFDVDDEYINMLVEKSFNIEKEYKETMEKNYKKIILDKEKDYKRIIDKKIYANEDIYNYEIEFYELIKNLKDDQFIIDKDIEEKMIEKYKYYFDSLRIDEFIDKIVEQFNNLEQLKEEGKVTPIYKRRSIELKKQIDKYAIKKAEELKEKINNIKINNIEYKNFNIKKVFNFYMYNLLKLDYITSSKEEFLNLWDIELKERIRQHDNNVNNKSMSERLEEDKKRKDCYREKNLVWDLQEEYREIFKDENVVEEYFKSENINYFNDRRNDMPNNKNDREVYMDIIFPLANRDKDAEYIIEYDNHYLMDRRYTTILDGDGYLNRDVYKDYPYRNYPYKEYKGDIFRKNYLDIEIERRVYSQLLNLDREKNIVRDVDEDIALKRKIIIEEDKKEDNKKNEERGSIAEKIDACMERFKKIEISEKWPIMKKIKYYSILECDYNKTYCNKNIHAIQVYYYAVPKKLVKKK